MDIQPSIPLVETILGPWRAKIGQDYEGYKNHVYRMIHFCLALRACTAEEQEKIIIAGCFHDIGIWEGNTVDYIPPSLPPTRAYLISRGLGTWGAEIELMITEHHKMTAYSDASYPLVELFRQGDLVDFSLGLFTFGLPRDTIQQVKRQFPNAGFHASLARRSGRWWLQHPLRPAPMLKW